MHPAYPRQGFILTHREQTEEPTCNASLADRRAALATRTLARTLIHMPTKPAAPEQSAPRRKANTITPASVELQCVWIQSEVNFNA